MSFAKARQWKIPPQKVRRELNTDAHDGKPPHMPPRTPSEHIDFKCTVMGQQNETSIFRPSHEALTDIETFMQELQAEYGPAKVRITVKVHLRIGFRDMRDWQPSEGYVEGRRWR